MKLKRCGTVPGSATTSRRVGGAPLYPSKASDRETGKPPRCSILLLDDDPSVRRDLGELFRLAGFEVRSFATIHELLAYHRPEGPACLVLDVRMPGRSGLELQRDLAAANRQVPIIFITAHADVPMTVQAMKGGAIEFLTKPFRDQDLLDAIEAGLARDRARRESDRALAALKERFL